MQVNAAKLTENALIFSKTQKEVLIGVDISQINRTSAPAAPRLPGCQRLNYRGE